MSYFKNLNACIWFAMEPKYLKHLWFFFHSFLFPFSSSILWVAQTLQLLSPAQILPQQVPIACPRPLDMLVFQVLDTSLQA